MFHFPHSSKIIQIFKSLKFSQGFLHLFFWQYICVLAQSQSQQKRKRVILSINFHSINSCLKRRKKKVSSREWERKFICIWCCLWERKKNISVSRNYINSLKAAIISLSLVVHFPMCESRELFSSSLSFSFYLEIHNSRCERIHGIQ